MPTISTHDRRARLVAATLAAAVAAAVLAIIPAAAPVEARASFQLERLAGAGRVQTAVKIARDAFTSADTALIVNKDDFPDGLAANYKAGHEQAPILMSGADSVPQPTLNVLDDLGVDDVILVGGTSVLRPSVRAQLVAEGYNVSQIGGGTRYETAKLVAKANGAEGVGTDPDDKKTAFLTTGLKPWDAIAASPISYAEKFPTLLTQPDALHPQAEAAIDDLGIQLVIILGGTGAVSQAVEDALVEKGLETARIEGDTRFDTAVAVATYAIDGLDYSDAHIDIATGRKFADALTGGPNGGNRSTPAALVLVGSVPEAVCMFLEGLTSTLVSGHIYGGTDAVSAADEVALEGCGGAGQPRSGVVTSTDKANNRYTFSDEANGQSVTVGYSGDGCCTVDGSSATLAAFEANLSVGDFITFFEDVSEGGTADEHALENRDPSDYTSGMVGDVDTVANTLHIIDPTTGVVLSDTKAYAGEAYTIDGVSASLASFENDLNEGDTIDITESAGTMTFALVNAVVNGAVGNIDKDADEITIKGLGDDPRGPQQDRYDYVSGASTNKYTISGVTATLAQFESALSLGDTIAYSREADEQTFTLTDQLPQGLLADGDGQEPDPDGDNDDAVDDEDGGTITLVNGSADIIVTYTANAVFRRNNQLVVETELESAYSAGDLVKYTPDNPGTPGNEEALELTNQNLQGTLADVSIGTLGVDDGAERYDVVNSAGNVIYNDLDYTDSVFGGSDTYFTSGASKILLQWEQDLSANANNGSTITVSGHPSSTRHDLTPPS